MRRRTQLVILLIFATTSFVLAQDTNPVILHEPQDWRFERIDFPLDFAPEIKYEGFEELRFAPGMFDTLSDTYFTYVFVISINEKESITKDELVSLLSSYYKGLCVEVAKSSKLTVDSAEIKISLETPNKTKENIQAYTAQIKFFDVFNTGQEVNLNIDLEIISNTQENKIAIIALVSPQNRDSIVWTALNDIRSKIKLYLSNYKRPLINS